MLAVIACMNECIISIAFLTHTHTHTLLPLTYFVGFLAIIFTEMRTTTTTFVESKMTRRRTSIGMVVIIQALKSIIQAIKCIRLLDGVLRENGLLRNRIRGNRCNWIRTSAIVDVVVKVGSWATNHGIGSK